MNAVQFNKPREIAVASEEQGQWVFIPNDPNASVFKVSFAMQCREGHTWGVSLLPNYQRPLGWNHCLKCEKLEEERKNASIANTNVEGENNDRTNL